MNVNELKTLLEGQSGDLQVRLVADHSQTPMRCTSVDIGFISEDTYMPDEVHEDDITDESIRVLMLEGF